MVKKCVRIKDLLLTQLLQHLSLWLHKNQMCLVLLLLHHSYNNSHNHHSLLKIKILKIWLHSLINLKVLSNYLIHNNSLLLCLSLNTHSNTTTSKIIIDREEAGFREMIKEMVLKLHVKFVTEQTILPKTVTIS